MPEIEVAATSTKQVADVVESAAVRLYGPDMVQRSGNLAVHVDEEYWPWWELVLGFLGFPIMTIVVYFLGKRPRPVAHVRLSSTERGLTRIETSGSHLMYQYNLLLDTVDGLHAAGEIRDAEHHRLRTGLLNE